MLYRWRLKDVTGNDVREGKEAGSTGEGGGVRAPVGLHVAFFEMLASLLFSNDFDNLSGWRGVSNVYMILNDFVQF